MDNPISSEKNSEICFVSHVYEALSKIKTPWQAELTFAQQLSTFLIMFWAVVVALNYSSFLTSKGISRIGLFLIILAIILILIVLFIERIQAKMKKNNNRVLSKRYSSVFDNTPASSFQFIKFLHVLFEKEDVNQITQEKIDYAVSFNAQKNNYIKNYYIILFSLSTFVASVLSLLFNFMNASNGTLFLKVLSFIGLSFLSPLIIMHATSKKYKALDVFLLVLKGDMEYLKSNKGLISGEK